MWDFFESLVSKKEINRITQWPERNIKRADWAEIRGNPQDCPPTTCFSVVKLGEPRGHVAAKSKTATKHTEA